MGLSSSTTVLSNAVAASGHPSRPDDPLSTELEPSSAHSAGSRSGPGGIGCGSGSTVIGGAVVAVGATVAGSSASGAPGTATLAWATTASVSTFADSTSTRTEIGNAPVVTNSWVCHSPSRKGGPGFSTRSPYSNATSAVSITRPSAPISLARRRPGAKAPRPETTSTSTNLPSGAVTQSMTARSLVAPVTYQRPSRCLSDTLDGVPSRV